MSETHEAEPNGRHVLRNMAVLAPSSKHRRVKEQRTKMFNELLQTPKNEQLAANQRLSTTYGVFKAFGLVTKEDSLAFGEIYREKEFYVTQATPEERRRIVNLAMDYSESPHPYAPVISIFLDTVVALTQKGGNARVDDVALMTRTATVLLETYGQNQ